MALDPRPRQIYLLGSSSTATSIVGGTKNDSSIRLHYQIAKIMNRAGRDIIINKGVNGATLGDPAGSPGTGFLALVNSQITAAKILPGYRPVVNIMIGSNDVSTLSRTPAAIYADLKTYVAAWKAAGFKVNVCTYLSWPEPNYTPLQTLNGLIRTGMGNADLTADSYSDVGGMSMFSGANAALDLTWYINDQTHANAQGIAQYASLIAGNLMKL